MKWIAVPIFLLLFITQTFSKWLIVAGFEANRDYISRNLCVNREKPKLHCKGKCQLMKRLAEEEKQDSRGTKNTTSLKIDDTLFTFQITVLSFIQVKPTKQTRTEVNYMLSATPLCSVFHPPALS